MADEPLVDEVTRMLRGLHAPTIAARRAAVVEPPVAPLPQPPDTPTCSLCRQPVEPSHERFVRGACEHVEHSECRDRLVRAGRAQCRACAAPALVERRLATACDVEARAHALAVLDYRRQKVRPDVVRRWHERGGTTRSSPSPRSPARRRTSAKCAAAARAGRRRARRLAGVERAHAAQDALWRRARRARAAHVAGAERRAARRRLSLRVERVRRSGALPASVRGVGRRRRSVRALRV